MPTRTLTFNDALVSGGVSALTGSLTIDFDTNPPRVTAGTLTQSAVAGVLGVQTFAAANFSVATSVVNGQTVYTLSARSTQNAAIGNGPSSNIAIQFTGQEPTTNTATVTTTAVVPVQLPYSGSVTCFCAGTRIRTATGEVRVEDLRIGDILVTADGGTRPVKWIGRQSVAAAFADPVRCHPVRVRAGALSEGVPARDLYLSPDHALLIDGVLVQAGALVNGSTVTRVENPEPVFTYYHVETEDHAVILAEGTPAETFVTNVSRRGFDNYGEYAALYGEQADFEAMADRPEPRAMSARQVPPQIRERMAERAVALMLAEPMAA